MKPTCDQLDNARRLADGLDKVAAEWPEHFAMGAFVGAVSLDRDSHYGMHFAGAHPAECGTTGCALGWAPYLLGIPLRDGEGWEDYGMRVIAPDPYEFVELFLNDLLATGTDGARAAAARLREYVARYESDCVEAGEAA